MFCRWPREWLAKSRSEGICLLEDPRQTNESWCHDIFVRRLSVSKDELKAQQLWAGVFSCIAGHPLAKKLLQDAWELAQQKDIIAGEKWSGMRNGKPFGHRHDQSILSILSMRMGIARYPMDNVYCDVSLRQTFLSKKSLYVHRGLYQEHHALASEIDDAYVINLDRRADRLKTFMEANVSVAERVHRIPAVDGKTLTLTPDIARLFKPHDFNWKKPVMGCALSHLKAWTQLANERGDINSYLIMEDDARLSPTWKKQWEKIHKHSALPSNWDVVYLGGILPPNKAGFEMVIEPVNEYIARIKENTMFGQPEPNRYMHFCAYAYVLSKRGAIKILEVLKSKGGYWTSADHMICNIHQVLQIYFTTPLLAGCFQDDDPAYCASAFNDFSRVDTFDSDLWNNTERFSEEEVRSVLDDRPLDIMGALKSLDSVVGAEAAEAAKATPVTQSPTAYSIPDDYIPPLKKRFVSSVPMDMSEWYEFSWIKQLFPFMQTFEVFLMDEKTVPKDCPIVILQRPNVEKTAKILRAWNEAGADFCVFHISDERCCDPIDVYDLEHCKGVVRNYVRPGLSEKVSVIPLGFHHAIPNGEPEIHTPRPPFRELVWSFVGTRWANRDVKLQALDGIENNKVVMMDQWNSPKMIGREETLAILLNSWCVPCPAGNNVETFRLYEALEAGAVPIIVQEGGVNADAEKDFLKMLAQFLPFMLVSTWENAAKLIWTLKSQPDIYEKYRKGLLDGWEKMKEHAKSEVAKRVL